MEEAKAQNTEFFVTMMKDEAKRATNMAIEIQKKFMDEMKDLKDDLTKNNKKFESQKSDNLDMMQTQPVSVTETHYCRRSYFWGLYSSSYHYETSKTNDTRVKFEQNAQANQKASEDNQRNRKANEDLAKHWAQRNVTPPVREPLDLLRHLLLLRVKIGCRDAFNCPAAATLVEPESTAFSLSHRGVAPRTHHITELLLPPDRHHPRCHLNRTLALR